MACPTCKQIQGIVQRALAKGLISRGPCAACGEPKDVQAHHESYDRPLDVTWLCSRHHTQYHRHLHGMGVWIY